MKFKYEIWVGPKNEHQRKGRESRESREREVGIENKVEKEKVRKRRESVEKSRGEIRRERKKSWNKKEIEKSREREIQ